MLDLFHHYKTWCTEPQILKSPDGSRRNLSNSACLWETQQLRPLWQHSFFSEVCLLCKLDHHKQKCRPCSDRCLYVKARVRCMASSRGISSAQIGTVTIFFVLSDFLRQYRSSNVLYSPPSSLCSDQNNKKEGDWEPWNKSVLFRISGSIAQQEDYSRDIGGETGSKGWFWIPRLWEYIQDQRFLTVYLIISKNSQITLNFLNPN